MKRYFAAAAIAVSLAALLAAPSHAQQYPSKPVNLVVPYSPGGAGDTAARKMADALSKRMGQPVVILNQAGVDGVIGATAVSRAVPDGYTLLAGDPGPINFAPLMRPGISYDPLKDFTLIAEYLYVPLIIVANPNTPFKTIKEMIAYAKANPGKVRIGYGSSLLQTGAELLKQRAGIDMLSVPYKAGAPSVQDTVAGHIDVVVTSTGPVSQLLAAGRLRPLAILGRNRISALPEVPTMIETGFPDFKAGAWFGILGPKGMPADVTNLLAQYITDAAKTDEIKALAHQFGGEVGVYVRDTFAQRISAELNVIGPLIKAAGMKPSE